MHISATIFAGKESYGSNVRTEDSHPPPGPAPCLMRPQAEGRMAVSTSWHGLRLSHHDAQSYRIHREEGDQREQRHGDDEPRVGHEIDGRVLLGSELNNITDDNNKGKIGRGRPQ